MVDSKVKVTRWACVVLMAGLFGGTRALSSSVAASAELQDLSGVTRRVALEGLALERMDTQTARLLFPDAAAGSTQDDGFELELWSGDRVRGKLLDGGEESLRLGIVGGASVGFPIESLRSVFATADLERASVLGAPEAGDRLWRRVGSGYDRIDGLLVGFGKAGLVFEGQLGEREYAWDEVAALWIESLGAVAPRAASGATRVAVDLVDGSRLRGDFLGIEGGALALETAAGDKLSLPLETLLEVALDDERLLFVSALAFESLGPEGLFGDEFGMRFPARRDTAVLGGPLVADGRRYARGIGVHAPSRLGLDWSAGGTLRGKLALDDSARRTKTGGSVIFRVYLDGELAFESEELNSLAAPVELPALALAGKARIELEVDAGSNSVIGDRADWLELRITKE